MADLASLLKDPNYTGANDATKQAIFDKFSQQDVNFTGANPQTQSAIRTKFGLTNAAAPSEWDTTTGPQIGMPADNGIPTGRKRGMLDIMSAPFEMGMGLSQKPRAEQAAFIAPTVEALGAAGGGMLGAPLGPAGAVAGAGAGYAGAKGLMRLIGGTNTPESLSQTAQRVGSDVLEGATYEAGGRVIGPALGYVAGKVADLRQIPLQKAAKIAKATLGDDLPTVLNNLRTASPSASVAELTAGVQNPAWQSLISKSLERDPTAVQMLRKMALTDEAAATNALAKLAGGSTATATRAVGETAKSNLNAITTPLREGALKRANLGQYVADEAALRQANDLAVAASTGGKIDPVQFATQATGAAKALQSVGIKPLEGAPLADRIAAISNNPEFAANDLIKGSTQEVANAIKQWTSGGGVIDANALEAIRKNAVNAAIAKLRPGADATSQRNLAASVMSKIKPMIDNAIEGAGGTGWRDYLTTHSKGMAQIAEKKLTGEALNLWKTDKDAFVKLVQGESPDAVEKILGPGKYDIAKEVADNTLSVLQEQAQNHLTKLSVKAQASEGGTALATVLDQQVSKFKLPSLLNFWSTVSNKGLEDLERRIGKSTMKSLTEAMKTPEGATKLLETLPAAERNRVINLLSNPSQWKSGTAAVTGVTVKNALAPEPMQSQNALAP